VEQALDRRTVLNRRRKSLVLFADLSRRVVGSRCSNGDTLARRSAPRAGIVELAKTNAAALAAAAEDPWGTPYRIVCAPDSAIAISAGRDRTFDTSDDVKSDDR
jgi:hypothetical protein